MRNRPGGKQGEEMPGGGESRCKGPEVGVLGKWVSSLLHPVYRGSLESGGNRMEGRG